MFCIEHWLAAMPGIQIARYSQQLLGVIEKHCNSSLIKLLMTTWCLRKLGLLIQSWPCQVWPCQVKLKSSYQPAMAGQLANTSAKDALTFTCDMHAASF